MGDEYPPPPPLPPPPPYAEGIHLPGTNLFMSVRRQLSSLEQPAEFKPGRGLAVGCLLAFIVGGFMPVPAILGLMYGIDPALGRPNIWVSWVFIAPLMVAVFTFLGLLIVGYFVLGDIPNRRYGVVFGALAGMGLGIFLIIIQIIIFAAAGGYQGHPFWYLMLPFEYLTTSTFLGIGVFALVAKARGRKGLLNAMPGLPLLFFLIYMVLEFIYEGIGTLTAGPYFWVRYFVLPLYLFILRDFLGGHFNFQNFFESVPEAPLPEPEIPPPPPP